MKYSERNPYCLRIDDELDETDREQLEITVLGSSCACSDADESGWELYPGDGQTQEEFVAEMEYLEGFNRPQGWLLPGYAFNSKSGEIR